MALCMAPSMHTFLDMEERFQQCCERAFAASLLLVSKCTGEKPDKLEEMYRKYCGDDVFKVSADLEADEVMPEEEFEENPDQGQGPPPPEQECEKFLLDFASHNDATLVFKEDGGEPLPKPPSELSGIPDQETLEKLMDERNPEEPFGFECAKSPKQNKRGNELPSSLREALAMPGCMFNALMRWNERKIAELNAEMEDAPYRGRSSRIEKWKELVKQAQKDLQASSGSGIDIGMILSVWKGVKQPKLHASGTPVESVSAFRVLVLSVEDPDQTPVRDWKCNDRSMAYVCRLEALVTVLDCESSSIPVDNAGDVKIKLTQQSAAALEKVEGLDTWTVLPTMIRGSKGHPSETDPAAPPLRKIVRHPAGPVAKAAAKKTVEKSKRAQAAGQPNEEVINEPSAYRRNQKGRELMQKQTQQLMKLQGAEDVNLEQVCEGAPECLDCMRLGRSRFHNLRSPEVFGDAVADLFSDPGVVQTPGMAWPEDRRATMPGPVTPTLLLSPPPPLAPLVPLAPVLALASPSQGSQRRRASQLLPSQVAQSISRGMESPNVVHRQRPRSAPSSFSMARIQKLEEQALDPPTFEDFRLPNLELPLLQEPPVVVQTTEKKSEGGSVGALAKGNRKGNTSKATGGIGVGALFRFKRFEETGDVFQDWLESNRDRLPKGDGSRMSEDALKSLKEDFKMRYRRFQEGPFFDYIYIPWPKLAVANFISPQVCQAAHKTISSLTKFEHPPIRYVKQAAFQGRAENLSIFLAKPLHNSLLDPGAPRAYSMGLPVSLLTVVQLETKAEPMRLETAAKRKVHPKKVALPTGTVALADDVFFF
eukprot:s2415_g6.t2